MKIFFILLIVVVFFSTSVVSCSEEKEADKKESLEEGKDKKNFVGEWTPDLGSVEIKISDAIPSEYTSELGNVKEEMKKNQAMADQIVMEFKEDGKLVVGPKGDTKEFNWDVDGNNLVISGDVDGQKFKAAFEITESTADEFTLKLTGSSVMEQAKEQYSKEVEQAMKSVPGIEALNVDKILSETWASMKFKKKQAA